MKIRSFKMLTAALVISLFPIVAAFADRGGDDSAEFKGNIERLPGTQSQVGDWVVSSRTVHVTSSTEIELEGGTIQVGAFVEVKGALQADGSVTARKIEVKAGITVGLQFKGTIQSFPQGFIGDWVVGGRTVRVSQGTRIRQEDGPVAVGAFVEIIGAPGLGEVFVATFIEVKSNVNGNDGRDELKGVIQSLPAAGFIGQWVVSGRRVNVTSSTVIEANEGPVAVGTLVEVKGSVRADGVIDAAKVETKFNFSNDDNGRGKANFKGVVESLPANLIGVWQISGTVVRVTASTSIRQEHGAIQVNTRVKVKGTRQADGSVLASRIQVRDSN